MRILVVDNGGQWTHREWRVLRDLNVEVEIIPNNTPLDKIKTDGLVLSGGAPRVGVDAEKMGMCGSTSTSQGCRFLEYAQGISSWPRISEVPPGRPRCLSSARRW